MPLKPNKFISKVQIMQFTLLGTGTPVLESERMSAASLLEVDDQHLLFDAGRGVTTQLAKAGKLPRQIDFIFITHHHYDEGLSQRCS